MMISSRGRYALKVMAQLALEYEGGEFVPLKEIAQREDISLKYVETIMGKLAKAKLVQSLQGKGGGYKLLKEPKEYKVSDILQVTEGNMAPVACAHISSDEVKCKRLDICKTYPIWVKFDKVVKDFFDSITLESVIKNDYEKPIKLIK